MKIKLDHADTKWSKLVRQRDGCCRRCGKRPPWVLQAHHIRPRGRSMTRYDVANGITLCAYCHTLGQDSVHRSDNQKAWLVKIIGLKEYNRLEKLSIQYKSRAKAKQEFLLGEGAKE